MAERVGSEELVVLVDEDDRPLGTLGKAAAHVEPGFLHRAVSVCLFDAAGRVLLQQRAMSKYHFPGAWANSCCTHPAPGESPQDAARRRAREELGIEVGDLEPRGTFVYRATDPETGLVEAELDHVFVGRVDTDPRPDPDEVMNWRYAEIEPGDLERFRAAPYSPWLHPVLERALGRPPGDRAAGRHDT